MFQKPISTSHGLDVKRQRIKPETLILTSWKKNPNF